MNESEVFKSKICNNPDKIRTSLIRSIYGRHRQSVGVGVSCHLQEEFRGLGAELSASFQVGTQTGLMDGSVELCCHEEARSRAPGPLLTGSIWRKWISTLGRTFLRSYSVSKTHLTPTPSVFSPHCSDLTAYRLQALGMMNKRSSSWEFGGAAKLTSLWRETEFTRDLVCLSSPTS